MSSWNISERPWIQRRSCWRLGVSVSRPSYCHRRRVFRCSTENFCYISVCRSVLSAVQHTASCPVIKMYAIRYLSPSYFPTFKIAAHRHRLVYNALSLPRPVLFNCSLCCRFVAECKYWLRLIHSSSFTHSWGNTVTHVKAGKSWILCQKKEQHITDKYALMEIVYSRLVSVVFYFSPNEKKAVPNS
jgi:hypothetical protein